MKLNIQLPSDSAEKLITAFEKKDTELQKRLPEFPILKIQKASPMGPARPQQPAHLRDEASPSTAPHVLAKGSTGAGPAGALYRPAGRGALILAVVFLGTTLLLGAALLLVYRDAYTQPTVNPVIANLLTLETRSVPDEQILEIAGSQPLVMILNLPNDNSAATEFTADIAPLPGSAGSRQRLIENLRRHGDDGYVALYLPPDYLSIGSYRIRLFEADDPNRPLAEYTFQLVPPTT